MEILLLHPGGLGDIILSLPAIALLRTKFPAARVTIACNIDHVVPVLGLYVDNAISLSSLPLHNLYSEANLSQPELRFWRSYDRIISWTGSGDAGFVQKMSTIHPDTRVASWRPGPQETRHVAQLFVDSLGPEIASGKTANAVHLVPRPELSCKGLQWLCDSKWNRTDSLVTLHPGAGSKAKCWPLTRYIRLARHLALHEKRKLLFVEGPADSGLSAQIARALSAYELIIAKSLPLDLLSAVIAGSSLFVGNDSGIAHLAAALGIPSIVLFGPTLPRHWAPLGSNVTVLRNPQGCKSCNSDGDEHTCLENISVEEVIRKIGTVT